MVLVVNRSKIDHFNMVCSSCRNEDGFSLEFVNKMNEILAKFRAKSKEILRWRIFGRRKDVLRLDYHLLFSNNLPKLFPPWFKAVIAADKFPRGNLRVIIYILLTRHITKFTLPHYLAFFL